MRQVVGQQGHAGEDHGGDEASPQPSQVIVIFAELNEVPGNKGFRDAVKAVAEVLEPEEGAA